MKRLCQLAAVRLIAVLAAVVPIALAGCDMREYKLNLKPQGNKIQRTLTVRRITTDKDEETTTEELEAEEIAAIEHDYADKSTTGADHILHIAGLFDGDMPDDIGNAGVYYALTTPMGTARTYVEHFRGNPDPVAHVQRMFAAADRLTDLTIEWLSGELGKEAQFDRLRAFLTNEVRHDMKNLAMYAWLYSAEAVTLGDGADGHDAVVEILLRAGLYLKQRGYGAQDDMLRLAHIVLTDEGDDRALVFAEQMTAVVKRKANITDPALLKGLGQLLSDHEAIRPSWRKTLLSSPEYGQLVANWEKRPEEDKSYAKPEPWKVLEDLSQQLLHIEFVGDGTLKDRLEVTVQDVPEPIYTNGVWDQKNRTVSWSAVLTDRPGRWEGLQDMAPNLGLMTGLETNTAKLPVLCYAIWQQADEDFQKKHFGKVVLEGNDLWIYCLWYKSLTGARAKEWDALIDGLKPGEESLAKLEAFRFSDEASGEDAPTTYAETAISLITSALAEEEAED